MAGSLLIGRIPVRYHDVAELCAYVAQHPSTTFGALARRYSPGRRFALTSANALLRETLGFATALGALESTGERSWDDRLLSSCVNVARWDLEVLRCLTAQQEPAQRAFRGVHDTLVHDGVMYTTVTDVVERMERSAYAGVFKWNDTKVNFWAQFMHDLGLITRLPPMRIALSPGTRLLRQLLPAESVALRPYLEQLHGRYFAVFTRAGDVHEGFARALIRLERQALLELTYESDARDSAVLLGRRVSRLKGA